MYQRDPTSKALINTEDSYYKAILARRQDRTKYQDEISNLHQELNEIKALLLEVVSGKNYG